MQDSDEFTNKFVVQVVLIALIICFVIYLAMGITILVGHWELIRVMSSRYRVVCCCCPKFSGGAGYNASSPNNCCSIGCCACNKAKGSRLYRKTNDRNNNNSDTTTDNNSNTIHVRRRFSFNLQDTLASIGEQSEQAVAAPLTCCCWVVDDIFNIYVPRLLITIFVPTLTCLFGILRWLPVMICMTVLMGQAFFVPLNVRVTSAQATGLGISEGILLMYYANGRGWVRTLFLFPQHMVPHVAYRIDAQYATRIHKDRALDDRAFNKGQQQQHNLMAVPQQMSPAQNTQHSSSSNHHNVDHDSDDLSTSSSSFESSGSNGGQVRRRKNRRRSSNNSTSSSIAQEPSTRSTTFLKRSRTSVFA